MTLISPTATHSVDRFVLDPRPHFPLLTIAKRYTPRGIVNYDADNQPKPLTLILTHASGHTKEEWQLTIEHLFDNLRRRSGIRVGEIWSIDCPKHGESSAINDGINETADGLGYAKILYLILTGKVKGLPTSSYFRDHRLVGVGHSFGGNTLLVCQSHPNPPIWEGMILVEPPILAEQSRPMMMKVLSNALLQRRDVWTNRTEAFRSLSSNPFYKVWDPRVLKIYCEYGLRDLPTKDYPHMSKGVTLSRCKLEEAAMSRAGTTVDAAYDILGKVCDDHPVYIIYGDENGLVSPIDKRDVIENAAGGRLAGVTTIHGVGHYVLQCRPQKLAEIIYQKVLDINNRSQRSCRL